MKYYIFIKDNYENNHKIMKSYPPNHGGDFRDSIYKLVVDLFEKSSVTARGYDTIRNKNESYWSMEITCESDNINANIREEYDIIIKLENTIDFN